MISPEFDGSVDAPMPKSDMGADGVDNSTAPISPAVALDHDGSALDTGAAKMTLEPGEPGDSVLEESSEDGRKIGLVGATTAALAVTVLTSPTAIISRRARVVEQNKQSFYRRYVNPNGGFKEQRNSGAHQRSGGGGFDPWDAAVRHMRGKPQANPPQSRAGRAADAAGGAFDNVISDVVGGLVGGLFGGGSSSSSNDPDNASGWNMPWDKSAWK